MSAEANPDPAVGTRPAHPGDALAVAAIFNQGIEDRLATFETRPQTGEAMRELITSGMPFVVAERGGEVLGFAKAGPYDDASSYYAEIAEATVYVERAERGAGTGRAVLEALARRAQESGRIKLTAKIFTTNEASIGLFRSCGFREVGVHERHGLLDGRWQDVLLMERRLGRAV